MSTVTSILAWIGGALALAAPFLIWLAKRYIDHAVQLRVERLKTEHGVKFAWQHEQVMKVATEIHQLLLEATNALGWVSSGYKIDNGPTPKDINDFTDAVAKLNLAVARNSMFLPKQIRNSVTTAAGLLMFAHNALLQARMFLDSGDRDAMSKAMANASRLHADEIRQITTGLEPEFRKLLLGEGWGD